MKQPCSQAVAARFLLGQFTEGNRLGSGHCLMAILGEEPQPPRLATCDPEELSVDVAAIVLMISAEGDCPPKQSLRMFASFGRYVSFTDVYGLASASSIRIRLSAGLYPHQ